MADDSANQARLVLHADDLGFNRDVTDGILRAFTNGLLTSTSILANAPDFGRSLSGWRAVLAVQETGELPSQKARAALGDPHLPFDLGVHLNLTQGKPLTGRCFPSLLLDSDGRFPGIFRVFRALAFEGGRFRRAVRDELAAQIERVGSAPADVTHLNGHQYVELIPLVGDVVLELANRYRIPCVRLASEPGIWRSLQVTSSGPEAYLLAGVKRLFSLRLQRKLAASKLQSPAAYFGTAHAGRIDLAAFHGFLRTMATTRSNRHHAREDRQPLFEVGFHPALTANNTASTSGPDEWHDPLALRRPQEHDLLTDSSFLSLLHQFRLRLGRLRELSFLRAFENGGAG